MINLIKKKIKMIKILKMLMADKNFFKILKEILAIKTKFKVFTQKLQYTTLIKSYQNNIQLLINSNPIFNLTRKDLEKLNDKNLSLKIKELNDFLNKICNLNTEFLNIKLKYEKLIFENNFTIKKLEDLKKKYLNEIKNLFN